jgi:hypothetical protein
MRPSAPREQRSAFPLVMALWWACQDLNLGPHPYQAYSRDAFKLAARETPAQRPDDSDRGCPLGTARDRPMWHASGTAGEDERGSDLSASASAGVHGEARPRRPLLRWQAAGGGAAVPEVLHGLPWSASCMYSPVRREGFDRPASMTVLSSDPEAGRFLIPSRPSRLLGKLPHRSPGRQVEDALHLVSSWEEVRNVPNERKTEALVRSHIERPMWVQIGLRCRRREPRDLLALDRHAAPRARPDRRGRPPRPAAPPRRRHPPLRRRGRVHAQPAEPGSAMTRMPRPASVSAPPNEN